MLPPLRLLITLGDVAGIGPEIVIRSWPELCKNSIPIVVGDGGILAKVTRLLKREYTLREIGDPQEAMGDPQTLEWIQGSSQDLSQVRFGEVQACAGQAAYDFLCRAIDLTLSKQADAIVTAPLHKEGLHAAGLSYPGHTEILADRTGTKEFAMVLYGDGIAVAHVTLHMALRDVFGKLSTRNILEKIELLEGLLPQLLDRQPRLAVAALNPHASDGGLFGDEEATLIAPAVQMAQDRGINVQGPIPADTLFLRAHQGEFDGIVAMYHDEGHIAMKLRCGFRCVNISAGLPIVRTSVAHGTAYNLAGQGIASEESLIAAYRCAEKLARVKNP